MPSAFDLSFLSNASADWVSVFKTSQVKFKLDPKQWAMLLLNSSKQKSE